MPKLDYPELVKRVVRTAAMSFIGVYGGANLVNAVGGSAAFNVSLAKSAAAAALVAVVSLLWNLFLDPSPVPSLELKGGK
jgi:hypothetical protein